MNSLTIYPAFLDFQEIVIIMVVAVVLFGPDKIPEIARGLGSAVRKLKEASEDIKQEIMNPIQDANPAKDIQQTFKELNPMDEIKDSFKKVNPIDDLKKSFDEVRNPIDEIDDAIHTDHTKSNVKVDSTSENDKIDKNDNVSSNNLNDHPPSDEDSTSSPSDILGMGGSVSR